MSSLFDIPSTETGRKMLQSVSPIYDRSYVGRWLFEVMGIEMAEARKYVDEFRLQAYPETATWGLRYWEQRYHIKTDERLPIEERRQRVIAKRWDFAPMNPARLEEYIFRACRMPAHVVEYNPEYRFEVIIDSTGAVLDFDEVYQLIRRAKPSHIAVTIIIEATVNIAIQPALERYSIVSREAGTYPYVNVVGIPIDTIINQAVEANGFSFESKLCGTSQIL